MHSNIATLDFTILKRNSMKRTFPLHDLGDDEFETLVACICQEVLGTGAIVFATGKDGGRDARFVGRANRFPSESAPLEGLFVIQAKHSANPVASISDAEFKRLLAAESVRIKALVDAKELEHYILATNRKCPADSQITQQDDVQGLGVSTVNFLGLEQIRNYLTLYPHIWDKLGFNRFETALRIQTRDLVAPVTAFHTVLSAPQTTSEANFNYVPKEQKNKINKLSDAYFQEMQKHSLPYFAEIESFLKNPRNEEYRNFYEDTADEIRRKLLTSGSVFDAFDEALTHIIDLVTVDPALAGRRRFAAVFLHYMYYTCDIGQHADAV